MGPRPIFLKELSWNNSLAVLNSPNKLCYTCDQLITCNDLVTRHPSPLHSVCHRPYIANMHVTHMLHHAALVIRGTDSPATNPGLPAILYADRVLTGSTQVSHLSFFYPLQTIQ